MLARIRACRICAEHPSGRPLPHEPRPVLQPSSTARILVAGQAVFGTSDPAGAVRALRAAAAQAAAGHTLAPREQGG
jgi:hypothetical protein